MITTKTRAQREWYNFLFFTFFYINFLIRRYVQPDKLNQISPIVSFVHCITRTPTNLIKYFLLCKYFSIVLSKILAIALVGVTDNSTERHMILFPIRKPQFEDVTCSSIFSFAFSKKFASLDKSLPT